ncbi:hypothetical protein K438DRAFT_1022963 [Mycena galopus ATCC 62051]|nr:hypothetical protein K438DRAFT_1022963 [Mycena galopus ATCC 62051]
MLNRIPASARHYASLASKSKKQKAAPQKPSPAPAPAAPSMSLRNRIMMSHHRNWEKAEQQKQQRQANVPEKPAESLSEEEQQMQMVEQLETQRELMRQQGRTPPVITLPLLDHMIPYSVGFKTRKEYPSVLDMYRQFRKNRINDGKNAFSMRHIGVADSFPGVAVDPNLGWFRGTYLYATRAFQAQSLKPDAWVAPMRQEILEQYILLNETINNGNAKRLADLTMAPYSAEALALADKKKTNTPGLCLWAFHREVTPTRILSLRAGDGEFSKHMPATGSRVAVQALVRFDTEQSIEMYDKDGRALHTPAPAAAPQPWKRGKTLHRVPAVPQRVTEYLVVDKAFYDPDGKWKFRARYVPEPGRTPAV